MSCSSSWHLSCFWTLLPFLCWLEHHGQCPWEEPHALAHCKQPCFAFGLQCSPCLCRHPMCLLCHLWSDWNSVYLLCLQEFHDWIKSKKIMSLLLRCVGVIQFVPHVLQLLQIGFTQRNLCCISKSTMNHQQQLDLPWSSCAYWKCTFVEYRSLPNVVQYWVK